MKKIKWQINVSHNGEFEVDDDTTEEEIDRIAQESAFEHIDWTWWEEE